MGEVCSSNISGVVQETRGLFVKHHYNGSVTMWIFRSNFGAVPERFQPFWREAKALNGADWRRRVFGAGKHRYRAYPVGLSTMEKFEKWCGVSMPPGYRDYMLTIGYGMGPYYGLWSPAQTREELEMLLNDWEDGEKPSPAKMFPYTMADAQAILARKAAKEKEPWGVSTWPIDGCIPICHQGCTYYSVLALTGECAGRVWDIDESGLWFPGHPPSGALSPPTFEEWLMGWIESAREELKRKD
jgi:hypothetical protein